MPDGRLGRAVALEDRAVEPVGAVALEDRAVAREDRAVVLEGAAELEDSSKLIHHNVNSHLVRFKVTLHK